MKGAFSLVFILAVPLVWAEPRTVPQQFYFNSPKDERFMYGVDLRDLQMANDLEITKVELATRIIERLEKKNYLPETDFFPNDPDVHFTRIGPQKDISTRQDAVFGVEFMSRPTQFGTEWTVPVLITFHSRKRQRSNDYGSGLWAARYNVRFDGGSGKNISLVELIDEKPLSKLRFQVTIGLIKRALYLQEPTMQIKKVFPVGVGAFDDENTDASNSPVHLLTPLISGGFLMRSHTASVTPESDDPDVEPDDTKPPAYYDGKPFIHLVGPGDKVYREGIHNVQLEPWQNDRWRPVGDINEALYRGYVSHGCIHLRDKDLYELHAIVMYGGLENVPLDVVYQKLNSDGTPETQDHIYPVANHGYRRLHYTEVTQDLADRLFEEQKVVVHEGDQIVPCDAADPHLSQLDTISYSPVSISRLTSEPIQMKKCIKIY